MGFTFSWKADNNIFSELNIMNTFAFVLALASMASAELIINEQMVFCNCPQPAPYMYNRIASANYTCSSENYSFDNVGGAACIFSELGWLSDCQTEVDLDAIRQDFANVDDMRANDMEGFNHIVENCIAQNGLNPTMAMRSEQFEWNGNVDFKAENTKYKGFLECMYNDMTQTCEDHLRRQLSSCLPR